jgi:hypothetical protein
VTESRQKRASGWLQVVLIGLLFGVPLVLAAWLYYGGSFRPAGRTNHGALLEPIVNLAGTIPASSAVRLAEGHWLLVYANDDECGAECRDALYTLRQSRLMLGHDAGRLTRVFLHGELAPDRVFLQEHHAGLEVVEDPDFADLLATIRPEQLPAGGFFLVDPLGNLVMYFAPDIDPGDMVDDIEHLLDLSRIG